MANKYLQVQVKGAEDSGKVVNTVMASADDFFDPAFKWILIEENLPHPNVGEAVPVERVPVITGKNRTFEPFKLSEESGGFEVSCEELYIKISCHTYEIEGLRQELTLICKHNKNKGNFSHASMKGVVHGEYVITWADVTKILAELEKLT